jgi:hypothetical protein
MSQYICTWIYLDGKDEESSYTQVGNNSSDPQFQEVYWRCVYVFFCTSLRNNPNAHHILFTNTGMLPIIQGISLETELRRLNVEVTQLPLTFTAPQGYFNSWRNQFYIFDILEYIGKSFQDEDCFTILDSDCIWVKSADEAMECISKYKIAPYKMPFSEHEEIHGLTRIQMKGLFEELLGQTFTIVPDYMGGEWVGATVSYIRKLNLQARELWNLCLERFANGQIKCNEEAHLLSCIYYKLGIEGIAANTFIRRIWTVSSIRRDVEITDENLSVWHCPSEKKYGIKRLFDHIIEEESQFWKIPIGTEFIEYLGRFVGIPKEEERLYPVESELRSQTNILRCIQNRSIAIFGSGKYGISVLNLLTESGISPQCFIDNDTTKWGTIIEGLPVAGGIDSVKPTHFVVIASYASAEMKRQLITAGLNENTDFIIYNFYQ